MNKFCGFRSRCFACGFVLSALLFAARWLGATPLPQAYPLLEDNGQPNAADEDLQRWLNEHALVTSPQTTAAPEWDAIAKTLDPPSRTLGEIARGKSEKDFGSSALRDMISQPTAAAHPLMPYIVWSIGSRSGVEQEAFLFAERWLEAHPAQTCPHQELALRQIERIKQKSEPEAKKVAEKLMKKVGALPLRPFHRVFYARLIDALPAPVAQQLKPRFAPIAKAYPKLAFDRPWLFPEMDSLSSGPIIMTTMQSVRDMAGKASCSAAQRTLELALRKLKGAMDIDDVYDTARAIETCYRPRGLTARQKFWRDQEKPLSRVFGFQGRSRVRMRLAHLAWGIDDSVGARKMFSDVVADAIAAKDRDIEGEALFQLAMVTDNAGDGAEAIKYLEQYLSKFPTGEHAAPARTALVMRFVEDGDWDRALEHATAMVATEEKLNLDEQSIGDVTFGLFWLGRILLAHGQREEAEQTWRRLATTYFSTYYGAMGHYSLEQLNGKRYVLEPSRSGPFQLEKMLASLKKETKDSFTRSMALLHLGMRNESLCEASQVVQNERDGVTAELLRVLVYHAAGEWLRAIKAYDTLPRTFRNSLPAGFERILFPKAFDDVISTYAKRLDVDPDFVRAIIRQESVFNPRAQSPVGARGLMQLMPTTATTELGRVSEAYAPDGRMLELKRIISDRDQLFESETNIALGIHHVHTLLRKYDSPLYVLTSYNASPSATERWIRTLGTQDPLIFAERIPYRETRAYVKLVFRNYFYYSRWYGAARTVLPEMDKLAVRLLSALPKAEVPPRDRG